MSVPTDPLADAAHFEALYRASEDPWQYATSDYELEKYRATLAALPRDSYMSALEIGCSIGVMTEMLAARCKQLLAIDVAGSAVRRAAERCRHLPHVRVEQRGVPEGFPGGLFDLVVLSETGYYLSVDDLRETARGIKAGLQPGGQLLLVHHTAPIGDATMDGDAVHDILSEELSGELEHLFGQRQELYRLDLLQRRAG